MALQRPYALVNPDSFTHFIAFLAIVARIADVVSTRLVAPKLILEANALIRRTGWIGAWATVLLGLVAYVSTPAAIVLIVVSLLVAGSNLMRGWLARFVGEEEMERVLLAATRQGRLSVGIAFVTAGGALTAGTGVFLAWLSGPTQWGYYGGIGIIAYGLAMAVHGTTFLKRLFRKASRAAVDD